jgi:hypothetical protein
VKYFWKQVKNFLFCIPSIERWWFINQLNTTKEYDQFVEDLIARGEIVDSSFYTAMIALDGTKHEIWIANYPYSYGYLWNERKSAQDHLPGALMITRRKLKQWLAEHFVVSPTYEDQPKWNKYDYPNKGSKDYYNGNDY